MTYGRGVYMHRRLAQYSISSLVCRNDEGGKEEEKWTKELNVVLKACSEVDYSRCIVSF